MALTPNEEAQIRDLLGYHEELLDIGVNTDAIITELGAGSTTVPALPLAAPLSASDVFYVAQLGADTKAQFSQVAAYIQGLVIIPTSRGKIFFMGQR